MNKHTTYTAGLLGFLATLATAMMLSLSPAASASTPDGETPANEGVCDVLQGGTPGLYGLCVAYCEAQDLDMLETGTVPNSKILANYRKKMRAGDPDMPCVQAPCPCWTAAELAGISSSDPTPVCSETTVVSQIRVLTTEVTKVASVNSSRNICSFSDSTIPVTIRTFPVTEDELQICRSQVQNACAALGQ
ncbi:MAG: hypothetical protein WCZ87_06860 [Thiohalobacteraceae bacterium]